MGIGKRRHLFIVLITSLVMLVCIVGRACLSQYADIRLIKHSPGYMALSKHEVLQAVQDRLSQGRNAEPVNSINDLRKGDILIRRYINKQTFLIDKIFRTYFTHTAVYAGNNAIYEAVGKRRHDADEIAVNTFDMTDFIGKDFEKTELLLVFRPKFSSSSIDAFDEGLRRKAEDNSYIFASRKDVEQENLFDYEHRLMCTSYVSDELEKIGVILPSPHIISPDYLFNMLISESDDFELLKVDKLQ